MESTAARGDSVATAGPPDSLKAGVGLMALGAAAFGAYAVVFFVRNFTDAFLELGIGHEQVDVGKDEIEAFSPSLQDYVSHLHIAVSGFILATAIAVLFLAVFGVWRGYLWAWIGAVIAPVVGLAVAIPAHYPFGFDTLGHLGGIYLATLIFVIGAVIALRPLLEARRRGVKPAARLE